jgi:hypothetical protein
MTEQTATKPITKTVAGNDVLRENLRAVPFWDGFIVLDPDSCTILTVGHRDHRGTVYQPYVFADKALACRWIANGYVSEIQEATSCLKVVFTNKLMDPPEWQTTSSDPCYKGKTYG